MGPNRLRPGQNEVRVFENSEGRNKGGFRVDTSIQTRPRKPGMTMNHRSPASHRANNFKVLAIVNLIEETAVAEVYLLRLAPTAK